MGRAFEDEVSRAHATLDAVLAGVHEPSGRASSAAGARVVVDPVADMDAHYAALIAALGAVEDMRGAAAAVRRILALDEHTPRTESRRAAQLFDVHLVRLQMAALRFVARLVPGLDRPEALLAPLTDALCAAVLRAPLLDASCELIAVLCSHAPEMHGAVFAEQHVLCSFVDAVCKRVALQRAPVDGSDRIRMETKRAKREKAEDLAPPVQCDAQLAWVAAAFRMAPVQTMLPAASRRALLQALARLPAACNMALQCAALGAVVLGTQPAYMPGDDEAALLVAALRRCLALGPARARAAVRPVCFELDLLVRPRRVGLLADVERPAPAGRDAAVVPAQAPLSFDPQALFVSSAFDAGAAVDVQSSFPAPAAAADAVEPAPLAAPARLPAAMSCDEQSSEGDSLPDIVD